MTLPVQKRRENLDDALRLMVDELKERSINTQLDPASQPFELIVATTWSELVTRGLVEPDELLDGTTYKLTGRGWVEGLRVSGRLAEAALKKKAGRLSAALKTRVKDRRDDALVDVSEVVGEADLSEDFIYNAIESHLLAECFKTTDASWEPSDRMKKTIRVPPTFGMEPL